MSFILNVLVHKVLGWGGDESRSILSNFWLFNHGIWTLGETIILALGKNSAHRKNNEGHSILYILVVQG